MFLKSDIYNKSYFKRTGKAINNLEDIIGSLQYSSVSINN